MLQLWELAMDPWLLAEKGGGFDLGFIIVIPLCGLAIVQFFPLLI